MQGRAIAGKGAVENNYQRVIQALREVPKVGGSFVLTEDGVVLASDLAEIQREAVLEVVGTKLLVLSESMGTPGDPCTGMELQFASHTLFGCRVGGAVLCVLAEPDVPAVQLQTAVADAMGKLSALRR